ncbi:hypothetical protein BH18ACT15_BH18ACT15_01600 [soil metagenome]
MEGAPAEDRPPFLPPDVDQTDVQLPEHGVGALFHRRYEARIRNARLAPEELITRIGGDPDLVAPTEFARFHKVRGEDGRMRVGDEFIVHMPGPWDGPVRVVDQSSTSFRFVTLTGHLEAGQIEFSALAEGDLVFTIESWARSGDRLSDLLFDRLRMAKEVQLHMWTSFIEKVARLSGGRMTGGISISTRRVDGSSDEPMSA